MQRYFAANCDINSAIGQDDQHHILRVMRSAVGDKFELVFNKHVYICEITCTNPFLYKINEEIDCDSEIKNEITLFFALSKGDKIDFVLQKATELGANRIVLFSTNRCVVKMDQDDFERKLPRYNKIVKEASEQSHRCLVPEVLGVFTLKNVKNLLCTHNFVAYEGDCGGTKKEFDLFSDIKPNETVSVFIGPEGGFSKEDIDALNSLGVINISLGKRILRCETAPLYALSVLGFILEK